MTSFWRRVNDDHTWQLLVEPAAKVATLSRESGKFHIACLGKEEWFHAGSLKAAKEQAITWVKAVIAELLQALESVNNG